MATNFKNLDYAQIKESLKEHLKSLKEFQDFDFDASGIQQILSLLAYNTAYNAFYMNMVGAEMFLDSAQLRSSVTARAKAIGYVPYSITSAKAKVRIHVDTNKTNTPITSPLVFIGPKDEFVSHVNGIPYIFSPDRTYVLEIGPDGKASEDLVLIEGKRLKFQYVVDRTAPVKQRFEIPNKNVDIKTLTVTVKASETSNAVSSYSVADNVTLLNKDSLVYFVQENHNGLYEVYFGEDILGVQPKTGNIVILEYIVSTGPTANGMKAFSIVANPTPYTALKITTVEPAKGGAEKEEIDRIRLLAPLLYESQDRAVTRNDYETLIRKDNPNVEFVRVWGGEDNVPPDYGKVFAAIKPKTGTRLSVDQKTSIVNRLLKERNVISVEVKLVDPDYLYMVLTSNVRFRSKATTLKSNDIKKAVFDRITEYKGAVLNGFDADFTHSKLLATIDSVNKTITGNITTIELKKRIYPSFNSPSRFELKFYNGIAKGDSANNISAVNSSGYIYRGVTTYFGDDGKGSLYLYRVLDSKKVVVQYGIGSVDYENGIVVVDSLDVQAINGQDFIDVVVKPENFNVYTPRECILLLEDSDIKIYVNSVEAQGETV